MALLQAVSAVTTAWCGSQGTRQPGSRPSMEGAPGSPGAMTGPDSALEFRDVAGSERHHGVPAGGRPRRTVAHLQDQRRGTELAIAVHQPRLGGLLRLLRLLGRDARDRGERRGPRQDDRDPSPTTASIGARSPRTGCRRLARRRVARGRRHLPDGAGPRAGMVRNGAPGPGLSLRRSRTSLVRGDDADCDGRGHRGRDPGVP